MKSRARKRSWVWGFDQWEDDGSLAGKWRLGILSEIMAIVGVVAVLAVSFVAIGSLILGMLGWLS